MLMLTDVCQELRNWFDRNLPKYHGRAVISEGELTLLDGDIGIADGQYFRVIGSIFNDGVHRKGDGDLQDEAFSGRIWAMAVPPTVIALADDIEQWISLYGGADSTNLSPYNSESFGGYSYSKSGSSSSTSGSGGNAGTWRDAFRDRLNRWRKI